MRIAIIAATVSCLMALGACSAEEPGAGAEAADDIAMQQAAPAPAQPAEPSTSTPDMIPAQFIGVWDYVEGTCAPESDLRLEISQADFTFYESYGEVEGVRSDGQYTIVTLAMEGEGEQWEDSYRLYLDDVGRLHTTAPGDPSATNEWPRKRCE